MIEFQNRYVKLPDGSPVIVCRIKGSIDGSTLQQFEDKLLGFLEQGVKHLIIVFSQVRYINSTGMGVLVKLADRFQEVGGDFNLVDVPDKMIALFNMLGLLALIKLSKNEEDALKSFQQKKSQDGKLSTPVDPIISGMKRASQPSVPVATTRVIGPSKSGIISGTTSIPKQVPPSANAPIDSQLTAARATQKMSVQGPTTSSVPTNLPSSPKPADTKARPKAKVYVITCKKCARKISLGSVLRPGNYKCPHCMAVFTLSSANQIQFPS